MSIQPITPVDRRATVSIVTAYPGPLQEHFLLSRLSKVWTEQGLRYAVGPASRLVGGLGLLHVDQTVVNPALVPRVEGGARLLNASVLDISKRRFSALLLGPDSDWDGPVILKTNANYHGLPETSGQRQGLIGRLRSRLPWRLARQLPPTDYPILERRADVPAWVWRRQDIVVERFLPERDGADYVLRMWLFFGDRSIVYRMVADRPVVKAEGIRSFETHYGEPPPEIAEARRRLGFDFGKFDYVLHEGRPLLLDINKTPAISGKSWERTRHLAEGLRGYLRSAA